MRIIIAGGRDFDNFRLLKKKCDYYLKDCKKNDIEIISGTAGGADKLGEKYAEKRGYKLTRFPADWSIGKYAGIKRDMGVESGCQQSANV
jgi:hypothetical protein